MLLQFFSVSKKLRWSGLLLLFIFVSQCEAQTDGKIVVGDSKGKDFWVCFPQNAYMENSASTLNLKLFITGDRATTGRVSVPGLGITKEFSLAPSEIIVVDIDSSAQILGSEQILKLGVHIESDNDITVYGLSNRKASTDTYLAFPTKVLGTTYRAVGYYPLPNANNGYTSEFAVVAPGDHTIVNISLTADTKGGRKTGETFAVELQKGDVYQVAGSPQLNKRSDLTGTLITSNKPIGLLVGHSCAQVPPDVSFCDQLLEMEPPIPSWGRQFYVGRFESKTQYALRVIASEDNTQVFYNNRLVAKLNAGQFFENNHAVENAFVTSSKPVLVAEYAQSAEADSVKVGDPFMLLIAPTEQFLNYYRFSTPIKGDWHHYLNLVVPTDAIASLRIDGRSVPDRYFHTIGISKFGIAQYEVGYGSHAVSCEKPFGLYIYGFGVGGDSYDSYGNCAGQLVETVPIVVDTMKPTLDLVSDDGDFSLNLIARDDRLFDLGLKDIVVIDSANFRSPVAIPRFDPGTSEVSLTFRIQDTSSCGFMSLRLIDLAGNESYYVICRTKQSGAWTYTLQEGREHICPSCRSWTAQVIATPSFTISDVTFNKPDYLAGCGTYNDFSSRLSGGFQGLYIFPFNKTVSLAGGIGFSNISGAAIARHSSFIIDSILYGDTAGARKSKLIEDFVDNASFNYLTLNGGVYYYFIPEKLYLFAGLAGGFLLSSGYNQTSMIEFPATVQYKTGRSTGTRQLTLGTGSVPNATKFHIALELSPGVQFKLSQRISLLAGAYLDLPFFDAVQDLNWHLTTFGTRIGLQYRN